MSELEIAAKWIYATLAADETLTGLIANAPNGSDPGIYRDSREQGSAFPCIVFQHMEGDDVLGVGARRIMHDCPWLIRAVKRDCRSYSDLSAIADRIDALLHRQSGSVTGGSVQGCYRVQPYALAYQHEGVECRELGGIYHIYAQEA